MVRKQTKHLKAFSSYSDNWTQIEAIKESRGFFSWLFFYILWRFVMEDDYFDTYRRF